MNPALIIQRLSFRYAGVTRPALSEISLSLPPKTVCAVLGPASSGKSTLFQALAGIAGKHYPAAEITGQLSIDGSPLEEIPREILFPTIGLVMQEPQVMLSGMYETVEQEIAFTLHNLGYPPAEIENRVQEILTTLHLQHLATRHPQRLSGGELQRVAMATILVAKPSVLLLDEPRNSLDCAGIDALVGILREYKQSSTILFSDYQIELALATADYILTIDGGKQLFFGPTAEFLRRIREFTSFLVTHDWVECLEAAQRLNSHHARRLLAKVGYHASV